MQEMSSLLLSFVIFCIFCGSVVPKEDHPYLVQGNCKGMWRPDRLVGRCFGLTPHHQYSQLKGIPYAKSAAECKSMCCNLGDECVTWQYEKWTKECKLGGKVRVGTEKDEGKTWCEPLAPAKWNGRKIESRKGDKCLWQADILDSQCYGLGSERKNSTMGRLDTAGCEHACCSDPACIAWQEMPGRGCFYTTSEKVANRKCDDNHSNVYDGQRKCLPGYCDGKEHLLPKSRSEE